MYFFQTEITALNLRRIPLDPRLSFSQSVTSPPTLKKCIDYLYRKVSGSISGKLLFEFNTKVTIHLFIIWFMINYIYYGQLSIIPFLIQSSGKFKTLLSAVLGEIPAIFLSLYLIDQPNFGRKRTLTIFFALSAVTNLFIFLL